MKQQIVTVIKLVTGDGTNRSVTSVVTSSVRRGTTSVTDQQVLSSQRGSNQASNYSSRRPLATQNTPQMLPVRRLAQHGMNLLISNNVCGLCYLLSSLIVSLQSQFDSRWTPDHDCYVTVRLPTISLSRNDLHKLLWHQAV